MKETMSAQVKRAKETRKEQPNPAISNALCIMQSCKVHVPKLSRLLILQYEDTKIESILAKDYKVETLTLTKEDLKEPYSFASHFSDHSFECILGIDVLGMCAEPNILLTEISRLTRLGGSVLIKEFNLHQISMLLDHKVQKMISMLLDHKVQEIIYYSSHNKFSIERLRYFTVDAMCQLLELANFKPVEVLGLEAIEADFFKEPLKRLATVFKHIPGSEDDGQVTAKIELIMGSLFPTVCPGFLIVADLKG